MKLKDQIRAMKSIRKPALPQNSVERPDKGGGYRRQTGGWQQWLEEDEEEQDEPQVTNA